MAKVTLELPAGTSLAETERQLDDLARQIRGVPGVTAHLRHGGRRLPRGGEQGRDHRRPRPARGPHLRPAGLQAVPAPGAPHQPGRRSSAVQDYNADGGRREPRPARPVQPAQHRLERAPRGGGEGPRRDGEEPRPRGRRHHAAGPASRSSTSWWTASAPRRSASPPRCLGAERPRAHGRRQGRRLPRGRRHLRRSRSACRRRCSPTRLAVGAVPVRDGVGPARGAARGRRGEAHRSGPRRSITRRQIRQVTMLADLRNYPLGEAMKYLSAFAAKELPKSVIYDFEGQGRELGKMAKAFVLGARPGRPARLHHPRRAVREPRPPVHDHDVAAVRGDRRASPASCSRASTCR